MKFKVTYEVEMSLPPEANAIKDLDPDRVAEALHGILDEYEDGRYDIARETLQALTRHRVLHAAYRSLADVLFARYGNRLMYRTESGSPHRVNVVSTIAQKRLEGFTGHSYVREIKVQKIEESDDGGDL